MYPKRWFTLSDRRPLANAQFSLYCYETRSAASYCSFHGPVDFERGRRTTASYPMSDHGDTECRLPATGKLNFADIMKEWRVAGASYGQVMHPGQIER